MESLNSQFQTENETLRARVQELETASASEPADSPELHGVTFDNVSYSWQMIADLKAWLAEMGDNSVASRPRE